MSDTPRTDAFVAGAGWTIARTSAEHFAKMLERESAQKENLLKAAGDDIAALRETIETQDCLIALQRQRIEELTK